MTDKPTKTVRRRIRAAKPKPPERHMPSHAEISERAYFIHLEEGGRYELSNWLRAETELTAA
jgi:hypothetical protein